MKKLDNVIESCQRNSNKRKGLEKIPDVMDVLLLSLRDHLIPSTLLQVILSHTSNRLDGYCRPLDLQFKYLESTHPAFLDDHKCDERPFTRALGLYNQAIEKNRQPIVVIGTNLCIYGCIEQFKKGLQLNIILL